MATHYDPEYEYENRAWNSNVILVLYFRNYQEILNTSFPSWPSFTQEEADAVQRVLLANNVNYWTGQETREFEREFAAYAGCRHAITLANGAPALDPALKGLRELALAMRWLLLRALYLLRFMHRDSRGDPRIC